MNVLLISTIIFNQNGISSVIMNFFRHMDKTGMRFDLVIPCGEDDTRLDEIRQAGGTVYVIPRKKEPLSYFTELTKLMKTNKYDVVHVHGNSATVDLEMTAAKLAGIPVRIAHAHNTETNHPHIHKMLRVKLKRDITYGLACGEEAGKFLFGNAPFTVLKGGIDIDRFRFDRKVREKMRSELSLEDKDILIGHVGNHVPQKNHMFLLQTAEQIVQEDPSYKFLLISGDSPKEEELSFIEEHGLKDNVILIRDAKNIYDYYQAMDLFILPSLHEGLPLSLTEAQTSGLKCIVSDRVTKEADLTETLEYLPISTPGVWKRNIMTTFMHTETERAEHSIRNAQIITEAGYDIVKGAAMEKELYEELLAKAVQK